ncbi:LOW QUALITY PROTEIN: putative uncharacterized protein C10orf128 homolog [Neophocaena asiaeorientalis asiaeorientalis]|uniref:Transmembrane protein 273 n=1 Tax=Neophocaena asiaeorientalis asiaeorientalis TaxID=1706337 RepID=A0A341AZR7_NEOAA|nr:LOW QUALITY PROTEIN: putative uncharacterized protein C10orf128 homolog [Neophocaena asiaeorientalis asiaeorientalis]
MDVGAAQVLATGQAAGAEIDIKNAIIGIAVGFTTSASFLALKICTIRKHLFDNDSSERRSTNVGFNDSIELKKRTPRTGGGLLVMGQKSCCQDGSPAQVIANSSNTESGTFPSICLLTLGNDFFPFCHQSG